MEGWIKLHRKMISWEWYGNIPVKVLFLHMLLKANHKDKIWRGILIKRGQFVSGRRKLAKETNLGEQEIRTAIANLQSTRELTIKSTNKFSLYTVQNYTKYQIINPQTNQQTNQQLTTTKNIKNIRNKEEEVIHFSNFMDFVEKRNMKTDIKQGRYLEIREEYKNRIAWWREVQKCINWCYDNNKKKLTSQRLRNWVTRSIQYEKDQELKRQNQKRDKNLISEPAKKSSDIPVWQPPA